MRLGHVHIPKCAGSALNRKIYSALGLSFMHIAKVTSGNGVLRQWDLKKNSLLYNYAKNSPYLSGHVNYSTIKKMNRDFVFTVLRDPYSRFFSLYTYNVSRSLNPLVAKKKPKLLKYHDKTFFEHSKKSSMNMLSRILLSDINGIKFSDINDKDNFFKRESFYRDVISRNLKKFDAIYFCPLEDIFNDLFEKGFIPKIESEYLNESKVSIPLKMGCNKKDFMDIMDRHCWLDLIVCEEARKIFPDKVVKQPLKVDDFLESIENRFDVIFD